MTQGSRDRFERLLGSIDGLPGHRLTSPSTVEESIGLGQDVTQVILRMARIPTERDGGGDRLALFITHIDGEGRTRLVLPDKAVRRIVAMYERLHDRSTPDSRKRAARTRELRARRLSDHDAGKHAHRAAPMRGCPGCERKRRGS